MLERTLKPAVLSSAFQKAMEGAGVVMRSGGGTQSWAGTTASEGDDVVSPPSDGGHRVDAGAGARLGTWEAIWAGGVVQWVTAKALTS